MQPQTFTSQNDKANQVSNDHIPEANQVGTVMEDNRPEAIAQGKMIDSINNSPKVLTQRKDHESIFGGQEPLQTKAPEEELQMKQEEELQMKPEEELQMMPKEEELQMKPEEELQMMPKEEELQMKRQESVQLKKSPSIQRSANESLPENVQSSLESNLGSDFSNVNIHPNSSKATEMNALAYTQGTDVHFAPGQFKPESTAGQKLIGHEFAHVVQQAEGRVKPTIEVNGMPVNDDRGLESEADRMGEKVARG